MDNELVEVYNLNRLRLHGLAAFRSSNTRQPDGSSVGHFPLGRIPSDIFPAGKFPFPLRTSPNS